MAKRKYTRFGETPKAFKCCNCKWEGKSGERKLIERKNDHNMNGIKDYACPKCGHLDFHGLLHAPTNL